MFDVNGIMSYAAGKRETRSGDFLGESAPQQIQFHTPGGTIFTIQ
jgi:hypothetical protein